MSYEPIEEINERPCVEGPCDPAPRSTHRALSQPLHPAAGARCPMCHNPVQTAEVLLRQCWVRASWWQRLDASLRWQRWVLGEELGQWTDTGREAVFGPCACVWRDTDNPLTDLVVLVQPCGAQFTLEPRRSRRGPHVHLRQAPLGMPCPCDDHKECER